MHQFTENHPEFKGFSEYYQNTIFPKLNAADGNRKKSLVKVGLACGAVLVLTVLAALFYYNKNVQIHPPKDALLNTLMLAIPLAGFGMFWVSRYLLKRIKSDTKDDLAGGICRFLGWHFSEKPHITPDLDIWTRLRLLPAKYQRVSFEDEMAGDAHGTSFLAREAHMQKKVSTGKSTHWVTVFRGSLMVINFKQKFEGNTVVLRKGKLLNPKQILKMKKVGLVDPIFKKTFQAYGTDQVEARYLLTPVFMQQLLDLETSVDGKKIRFGFWEGQLLIAVETKDRFESGSMLKPLTEPSRAQKILDEIGAVYDVIDGVLAPRK